MSEGQETIEYDPVIQETLGNIVKAYERIEETNEEQFPNPNERAGYLFEIIQGIETLSSQPNFTDKKLKLDEGKSVPLIGILPDAIMSTKQYYGKTKTALVARSLRDKANRQDLPEAIQKKVNIVKKVLEAKKGRLQINPNGSFELVKK